MMIRTYGLLAAIPQGSYVTPSENIHNKARSMFMTSEAHRILVSLDIPWRVHARPLAPEIIFMMTEHQYTLWRIAGGDHWCVQYQIDISTPNFYEIGMALNSAEGSNMRPWKLDFVDGMASWSRGDQHQISLYYDGTVRLLRFGTYVDLVVPNDSCDIATKLALTPFAKMIGL